MFGTTPLGNTEAGRCADFLAQPAFTGLKAILDHMFIDAAKLYAEINAGHGFEELLTKLGYKTVLIKQIHIQDCYWRMGPAGSIRPVLPYYDISTQSSFPTLVNSDSTVTTTPKALVFFHTMLAQLKRKQVRQ